MSQVTLAGNPVDVAGLFPAVGEMAQPFSLVAKDLAATSPSWWLRVENGKARFLISDNTVERVLYSSVNINDGQWHHIAAVRDVANPDARQLRLYAEAWRPWRSYATVNLWNTL